MLGCETNSFENNIYSENILFEIQVLYYKKYIDKVLRFLKHGVKTKIRIEKYKIWIADKEVEKYRYIINLLLWNQDLKFIKLILSNIK